MRRTGKSRVPQEHTQYCGHRHRANKKPDGVKPASEETKRCTRRDCEQNTTQCQPEAEPKGRKDYIDGRSFMEHQNEVQERR